jgi:hypothetical protein
MSWISHALGQVEQAVIRPVVHVATAALPVTLAAAGQAIGIPAPVGAAIGVAIQGGSGGGVQAVQQSAPQYVYDPTPVAVTPVAVNQGAVAQGGGASWIEKYFWVFLIPLSILFIMFFMRL